jgi:DNA-binding FadR family transcriptional regulator
MSKHDEIAETLTRDILTGQYRVGERLPSERDLAARFDASRGAVREAMKKLEQLGIADIQPGGARVGPLNEASLDVIGHLLAVSNTPSRELVDQILVVTGALVQTAVLAAVQRDDEEVLDRLRALIRPIWAEQMDLDAHFEAQTAMFRGILEASGNLPVQLIAKSLLEQFAPQMGFLRDFAQPDMAAQRELAKQMDAALATGDLNAIRTTFAEASRFHRERTQEAFDAYETARHPNTLEVSAS